MDLAEAILEVNRVALEGLSGPDTERAICVLLRAHLADSAAHEEPRFKAWLGGRDWSGPLTAEEKEDVHKALKIANCQHNWAITSSGWMKCTACGAERHLSRPSV